MNPKHTRRPIRVINGDIMAVARELLQNNAEADSKAAILNLVVDPVVDGPNGAKFKKGFYATLRRYKLHSNAHTTHYRTLVVIVVL